ncbi:MAG: hypothetical protein VKP62_08090 [Candidatus Sericytochromatia bacterium]|nr:hypothetical protein [Candidatus Sericytochromatia bacterium]
MSIRTILWLASSLFMLTACAVFIWHQRASVDWSYTVFAFGALTALVVLWAEWAIASPLDRMVSNLQPDPRGHCETVSKPTGWWTPHELRVLWRSQRGLQEQAAHLRLAKEGLEARLEAVEDEARLLRAANGLLYSEEWVPETVFSFLEDLAGLLGAAEVWLVPVRRHPSSPLFGSRGVPPWADLIRPRASAVWSELIASPLPRLVCVLPGVLPAAVPLGGESLTVYPLFHRGRPQGFLLVRWGLAEPPWAPKVATLLKHIAPALAAAMYPYRWPDGRRVFSSDEQAYMASAFAES